MLDRRTILVTGGSAGIGAATALEAARSGWRVAIGARGRERLDRSARAIREAGGEVFAAPLDVSKSASVDEFFDAAEAALGPIDVVVNNAGRSRPGLLHEYHETEIESEIATNLLGSVLVARRGIQSIRKRFGSGDIVFMTSDAVRNPRPGQVVYGATKAAIENLAEGLTKELEGTGIRVTTLRIGPTLTEFGAGWTPEQIIRALEYWKPYGMRDARLLGALLDPSDVARAVIHAVSQPRGMQMGTIEIQPEAPKRPPQP